MPTNQPTIKASDIATKVIEKIMLASGIFAYVWILAFLLVAMISN